MHLQRKWLSAAVIIGTLITVAGCAQVVDDEPADVDQEFPTETYEFRVEKPNDKTFILLAPEGEPKAEIDLVGEVAKVGTCLGVKETDQGDLTVVWPYNSILLTKKVGLEFPTVDADGDRTRARFSEKQSIVLTGEFVTEASWMDEIPEACPVPEDGVFLIQNASHPQQVAEEAEKDEG